MSGAAGIGDTTGAPSSPYGGAVRAASIGAIAASDAPGMTTTPRSIFYLAVPGVLLALTSGCMTMYLPKVNLHPVEMRLTPSAPVFCGPGGVGPIWSPPEVTTPGCCRRSCDPCQPGPCCEGNPLQPIDPFGWLKSGSMGTQVVDPVGWVFGL